MLRAWHAPSPMTARGKMISARGREGRRRHLLWTARATASCPRDEIWNVACSCCCAHDVEEQGTQSAKMSADGDGCATATATSHASETCACSCYGSCCDSSHRCLAGRLSSSCESWRSSSCRASVTAILTANPCAYLLLSLNDDHGGNVIASANALTVHGASCSAEGGACTHTIALLFGKGGGLGNGARGRIGRGSCR